MKWGVFPQNFLKFFGRACQPRISYKVDQMPTMRHMGPDCRELDVCVSEGIECDTWRNGTPPPPSPFWATKGSYLSLKSILFFVAMDDIYTGISDVLFGGTSRICISREYHRSCFHLALLCEPGLQKWTACLSRHIDFLCQLRQGLPKVRYGLGENGLKNTFCAGQN